MADCTYTIDGKTYSAIEFDDYLRALEPHDAAKFMPTVKGLPPSPFKTTWPQLAMKRITKWAVDHGFDRVAWVPGDVQAERYDLSKHIDELHWQRGNLTAYGPNGEKVIQRTGVQYDELPDLVGKEIADRLLDTKPDADGWHSLTGLDLKTGSEGMRGFYDKILPTEVQKIVGKFGAKVGKSDVQTERPFTDVTGDLLRRAAADARAAGETEGTISFLERQADRADLGRRLHNTLFMPEFPGAEYVDALRTGDWKHQQVYSFDITPEMRRAVQSEGLALFEERAPLGQWGRLRRGR